MPKSQGKSLSYKSYEACVASANAKGVSASPCASLKKGSVNKGAKKPASKVSGY
jgi:hypothetical protein